MKKSENPVLSFIVGFLLFSVPTVIFFLVLEIRTSRMNDDFNWLFVLTPSILVGCWAGYKTATNKIYKYGNKRVEK